MPAYGETRGDGYRFKGYRNQNGKRYEHWLSPAAWSKKAERLAAWRKADYAANLTEARAASASYMRAARRERPVVHMLARARHRAKESGLPFNLTAADVAVPERCPVLGVPFTVGGDFAPSLDRRDNARGYIRGNVVVVSHRVNRIKSDASVAELEAIAFFYANLGE